MIEHVVLLRLRSGLGEDEVERTLRETRIRLLKCPHVRGLRCGVNREPGCEWPMFLLVAVESKEKLNAYLRDPAYLRLWDEVISPMTTAHLMLEYESDPGPNPLLVPKAEDVYAQ